MSSTGTKTTSRRCSRSRGGRSGHSGLGVLAGVDAGALGAEDGDRDRVHRWDAEQAFGDPGALTDLVALSGLNEFETMWLPRLGELPVLEVKAVDLGRTWMFASGSPLRTVSGTASDLYLRLCRDLPGSSCSSVGGVDGLEPPPKR